MLNPIKPIYDIDQLDGLINLTAGILAVLVAGPTAMLSLTFFPLTMVVTIDRTRYAYPHRDGQIVLARWPFSSKLKTA